jgi:hypothetical protein
LGASSAELAKLVAFGGDVFWTLPRLVALSRNPGENVGSAGNDRQGFPEDNCFRRFSSAAAGG